jgi:hypothetical protein
VLCSCVDGRRIESCVNHFFFCVQWFYVLRIIIIIIIIVIIIIIIIIIKHAMKTYFGICGMAPRILTSTLDGGEWSASRPGRFTPREIAPNYPLDRRPGGPQSRSGRGSEDKNSQPLPGLEPPIIWPVAQRCINEVTRLLGTLHTHWIGGWVGPRAGLDAVVKRKNPVISPAGMMQRLQGMYGQVSLRTVLFLSLTW